MRAIFDRKLNLTMFAVLNNELSHAWVRLNNTIAALCLDHRIRQNTRNAQMQSS
jgi:hypothetical protein